MGKLINNESFKEAMLDLNKYLFSKGYDDIEIVALCQNVIVIVTSNFTIRANSMISKSGGVDALFGEDGK